MAFKTLSATSQFLTAVLYCSNTLILIVLSLKNKCISTTVNCVILINIQVVS